MAVLEKEAEEEEEAKVEGRDVEKRTEMEQRK